MLSLPAWRFREMGAGEVYADPVHDQFFKMQDLADALVREAIQNSLDARRGRSPARVRFAFHHDVPAARYFRGLREHLEASEKKLDTPLPAEDESIDTLVIEDFGTRGLEGDPFREPDVEEPEEERNDFAYFFRNVGRSSKGDTDRGRWGLGKAVFAVASRIRTFFGYTVRASDGRALLMGQSVLKIHQLGRRQFCPYGFYSRLEGELQLPIDDEESLDRFHRELRLGRVAEPGLSIVIPHYRSSELHRDEVTRSIIRQYFYPITRGDLTIEIEDGIRSDTIDRGTIRDVAEREFATTEIHDPEVVRLCELAQWAVRVPDDDFTSLPDQPLGAPRWEENLIDPDLLAILRKRFDAGDRLAFRVPVLVKRKGSRPAHSYFDVFIEKDETLRKGEHHFIRRGITIPEVKSNREKPVRGLVVVEDRILSTFLGDAENPAHSDWLERADKIRESYEHGAHTVRFVKQSLRHLASILSVPPAIDARLLESFFSIDAPVAGPSARPAAQPRPGADGESGTERVEIKRKPSPLALHQAKDGFVIRGADPRPLEISLAYRVRGGNPIKKHSPFDFRLDQAPIRIEATRASVLTVAANRLRVAPEGPEFEVRVHGFDPRRDLVIKIDELTGARD